jgi:hypothetical protein
VTYTQDDERNRLGDLSVRVQVGDFCGHSNAYLAETSLSDFAEQLEAYPMPEHGVGLKTDDAEIAVAPLDAVGHLRLTVRLTSARYAYAKNLLQEATLQIATDYAAVETFRKALAAAVRNGGGEAVLIGDG